MVSDNKTLYRAYMIMAIVFGLAYMLVFSPWIVNDADSHIGQSITLANQIMGLPDNYARECESDGVVNLFPFINDNGVVGIYTHQERIHYDNTIKYFELFSKSNVSSELPYSVDYMSFYGLINYVPFVLGIVIGRVVGLGFIPMLYLSRLLAFCLYTYLSYRAILRTPIGKYVFALFALIPTNLLAITSFTYDSVVLVVSLNFIASFFYYENKPNDKSGLIELFIWTFLLGGVKGGSHAFLALILLTLIRKNKKESTKAIALLTTCIISLVIFDFIIPAGQSFFQLKGATTSNLDSSFVFEHPIKYFLLCFNTYKELGLVFYLQMFGTNPTNCDFISEMILPAILFSLIIPICALADNKNSNKLIDRSHILLALIINAIALLFIPAMLLRETGVNDEIISGIQGRYYIPLLPILYLCIARLLGNKISDKATARIRSASIVLFGIINCAVIYLCLNIFYKR
ncbi:MAG: DUF2142 domain-containing protein [Saccharofermentans sp.]|nr:DUF2142 domain-containing protein [Saccharofermentans sp.]